MSFDIRQIINKTKLYCGDETIDEYQCYGCNKKIFYGTASVFEEETFNDKQPLFCIECMDIMCSCHTFDQLSKSDILNENLYTISNAKQYSCNRCSCEKTKVFKIYELCEKVKNYKDNICICEECDAILFPSHF